MYSKKSHLQTNIEAIRIVFTLEREKRQATDSERAVLQSYSGFGGLKCILNPAQNEKDKEYWTKTDLDLFPLVADLHALIRENSVDERQYRRYFDSLKNSVLTAFYTPPEIINSICQAFATMDVLPTRFLDPSAGSGAFAESFKTIFPNTETVCFEKDLLTGKILSHLYPDFQLNISGFEEIESRPDNHFDLISSNIPFGDTAVFDPSFVKSTDIAKRQSARSIHNYFFVKSIECLREGGILAFITSQGVMNSPQNEPVRKWLMDNASLVSAVRLPNNLFSDFAGAEVGSDLIVLQRNRDKVLQRTDEQAFIKSRQLSNGENVNNLFQNFDRVVHTKAYVDTDPYGKPATVFIHDGGIDAMATDLKRMLFEDFSAKLNKKLYLNNVIAPKTQISISIELSQNNNPIQPSHLSPKSQSSQQPQNSSPEPVLSLYDLFGFSEKERQQLNSKKKDKKKPPSAITGKPFKKEEKQEQQNIALPIAPRPFSDGLQDFHRQGSLVIDSGQVGFLKERYRNDAVFMPLELNALQKQKAEQYIKLRDAYHLLYNYEAKEKAENPELRKLLNSAYNDFVRHFGNLNDRKNFDLIKMDTDGQQMLSLEKKAPPQPSPKGRGRLTRNY